MLHALMSVVYSAISSVLLFWHAAWNAVLGDAHGLATDWAWVLGIVFLVLTVRTLLLPIYLRQVRSQEAMQRLAPRLKQLNAEHKGDPQRLQTELATLYREEKVSPFGAVLPMVLQIPVFIGLLHVLRHLKPTMSAAGRTLYGWTATEFGDAVQAKLFGASITASLHSGGVNAIVAAVLIAAMIATTYVTTRLSIVRTGWASDPQQRTIQRLMLYGLPLSLLVSGAVFPIGVVLYWTTQNLFALGQQTWLNRRSATVAVHPSPRVAATTPKVGVKPSRS